MTMKMGKKIRTWELRQRYRVIAEDAEKKPNRKRSIRYGYAPREERIAKYGIDNYLVYGDEYVA